MTIMNRIALLLFVASTLCLLTACGPSEEARRADVATQQAAQAQERAQKEQKGREEAEKEW